MEYFDRNYGKLRQRTLEWAERESVSLLDVEGIGAPTRKALRQVGIETASQSMHADPDKLARELLPHNIPPCGQHEKRIAIVKGWQEMIALRCAERERQQQATQAGIPSRGRSGRIES